MTDKRFNKLPYRTQDDEKRLATLLNELGKAELARKKADQRVKDAVAMLRAEDLDGQCLGSWEAIAAMLGVTRQAAHQRFGRYGIH